MQIQQVSIKALNPAKYNPRKINDKQLEGLRNSIRKFGLIDPIIVNKNGNVIVGGHQRTRAAEIEGYTEVPVVYVELSPAEEKALNVALNSHTISGAYDMDILPALLGEIKLDLPELFDDLNFDDFELPELEVEVLEGQTDEDEVPEVVDTITKRGDVWLLGNHRVMCGDSTMIDDVEKLMNGEKADITFTSPPYNAGKTPKENGKYLNDNDDKNDEEYLNFLNDFTNNALMVSDYVFSNIQSIAGNKLALIQHLYAMQEKYADTIIWDKGSAQPAMAHRVLNSAFEYIHVFSNTGTRAIGKRDFRGTISNIFTMNSKSGKDYAKVHKATFRVELPEMFINNHSESSCFDPFNGTGTTLIACEKNSKVYYGMELDPQYLDITITRWQNYTGKEATLESTGETYNSLKGK